LGTNVVAISWTMSRKTAADREKEELTASILEYFASIPDPRVERTFEVNATDSAGGTLTFAWSATAGSLGSPTSTGASSTVQWTAPAAGGSAWQVKVTVTNAKGIFVNQVFPDR